MSTNLVRSRKDERLLEPIFREKKPDNHRPKAVYSLIIGSIEDVDIARELHVPKFTVTDQIVSMLGYRMHFPPFIVVPRYWSQVVETGLTLIEFATEVSVFSPHLEDIIVAMLKFDPIASRAITERNQDLLDMQRLLKRIYQEDLQVEASRVRFQDLLATLPDIGNSLPKKAVN